MYNLQEIQTGFGGNEAFELASQTVSGNSAAATSLAARETLIALGIPEDMAHQASQDADPLELLLTAVTISKLDDSEKGKFMTHWAHSIDESSDYFTNGRRLVLKFLSRLDHNLFMRAEYEEGFNHAVSDRVANFVIKAGRVIPRVSWLDRWQRRASSPAVMRELVGRVIDVSLAFEMMQVEESSRADSLQTS
ncbi:MAG: hypothetical protein ACXWLH_06040 [Candidatus Saccharimonadales bacterium]